MGFVNEVVTNEMIDKYHLPFQKDNDDYWTFDAERNIYLWGGLGGNPAFGLEITGGFNLFINGNLLRIKLKPGHGSIKFSESPYYVVWDSIISISPNDLYDLDKKTVIEILKEALTVYGEDGRQNKFAPEHIIQFNF